jgi:hypothetical protein
MSVGHPVSNEETRRCRFELLMLDYEMARDDERTFNNTQATMFGIAVALLAVLIPLLSQTCAFSSGANAPSPTASGKGCTDVPIWLVAAAPLAPLALVGFLAAIGTTATIRSYYLRAIEAELQTFGVGNLANLPVPPASLTQVSMELLSLRRGRIGYRLLYFTILFATLSVFGGITAYIIWKLPPVPKVISGALYTFGVLSLAIEVMRASVGGRGLFADAVRAHLRRRVNFPDFLHLAEFKERSLIAYLLLPRPRDAIKWIFLPASFAMGVWALHLHGQVESFGRLSDLRESLDGATTWAAQTNRIATAMTVPAARLVVVFVILELLIYEARYQWNDIRGLTEDIVHPISKGRLPVGFEGVNARRNVLVSGWVAVLRLAAAMVVAFVIGHGMPAMTALLFVVVFGVALVYEVLRSRETGNPESSARRAFYLAARPAQIPRPVDGQEFQKTWTTAPIWIVVGSGYAIRGTTGLIVAGVPAQSPLIGVAAIGLLAFGIAFVTLTWVLDASSHCLADPAGGRVDYVSALVKKPHLAALLPYVGAKPGREVEADRNPLAGAEAKPLSPRGRLSTPWNTAMLYSGAAAGTLGAGLAVGWTLPDGPYSAKLGGPGLSLNDGATAVVVVGTVVGFCAAWILVRARHPGERWFVVLFGAVAASIGLWPYIGVRAVLAILPWMVFAGWYTWFRSQSFLTLKYGLKPLVDGLHGVFDRVVAVLAGRRTAAVIDRKNKTSLPCRPTPRIGPASGGEDGTNPTGLW